MDGKGVEERPGADRLLEDDVEAEAQRLIDVALAQDGVRQALEGSEPLEADVRAHVWRQIQADRRLHGGISSLVEAAFTLTQFERTEQSREPTEWIYRVISFAGLLGGLAWLVLLLVGVGQGPRLLLAVAVGGIGLIVLVPTVARGRAGANRRLVEAGVELRQTRDEAIDNDILPLVRQRINELSNPAFNRELAPIDHGGLRNLFDSKYEVSVRGTEALQEALRWLDAGSVGIAGPRGVGKTTLIRAACEGRLKIDEAQGDDEKLRPLGVMVSAPVRYEAQDFVRFMFAQLCLTVLSLSPKEAGFESVRDLNNSAAASLIRSARRLTGARTPERYPIRALAAENLDRLRYLETLSKEQEGQLKLQVATLGEKRGTSRAEQAWSFPEVIEEYRRFLGQLADRRSVVIGIDELDKMASSEEARGFLNELKSLLDQPRVFYLVSMSEDALSDFERRGQPIRDVFDSVFNDVLHVDYLSRRETDRMLRSRAIGIPPPWPELFHCLAGGLPRESIRVARRAVQIAELGAPDLTTVTIRLVAERAAAHEHAAGVVAQGKVDTDGTQGTLIWLRELPPIVSPRRGEAKPLGRADIESAKAALLARLRVEGGPAAGQERLTMELAAGWYHALSCLEFFAELGEHEFDQACEVGADGLTAIELLARGHQDLSVSPALSWQTVSKFRQRVGLDTHL